MLSSDTIRILIVDDHPSVREGLAEMISAEAGMAVVGTACDGAEAVALHARLRPDVTVIDLRLPGLSGIEAIRAIRRRQVYRDDELRGRAGRVAGYTYTGWIYLPKL